MARIHVVDPDCYDLAYRWLLDCPTKQPEARVTALAKAIQTAIEDELEQWAADDDREPDPDQARDSTRLTIRGGKA